MTRSNFSAAAASKPEFSSRSDRFFRIISLLSLLVLAFIGGSILAVAQLFPGPQIARAYQAGEALYSQLTKYQDVYSGDLWYPERGSDKGVTAYRRGKAQEGLTLYISGSDPAVILIDMNGKVVHEWRRPFSTVWEAGAGGVDKPRPDPFVYFRDAYVFPNGDLLAVYEGNGDTPYGYGVVKLDRNSNVIWSYTGRAHHDLDVAPDGKIYALTHEIVDDEIKGAEHLKPPRLDDFLVVLSPTGEELKKIPLVQSIAKSKYRHLFNTVSSFAVADPLHGNAVDFVGRDAARNFTFGEEGQLLLSFRELNAIVALDPETGQVTWATRGPWIGQHDPDILSNGN